MPRSSVCSWCSRCAFPTQLDSTRLHFGTTVYWCRSEVQLVGCRYRYTKLAPGQHGGLQHSGPLPRDGFLDGDLLLQFGNLSRPLQREIAKEAGTSVEDVLAHLRDVLKSGG